MILVELRREDSATGTRFVVFVDGIRVAGFAAVKDAYACVGAINYALTVKH